MGLFDIFGRDRNNKTEQRASYDKSFGAPVQSGNGGPIHVAYPKSYEDVQGIIDFLKNGTNAVVHLNELKTETAIRILDMLSGAIYALGGGVYEIQTNVFMFSPSGVIVNNK
ncbi:MAG: cell division protein SepF [Clostridia bacterium]|nr:cell division protein SepF [Clostridia bacterium]